ncbi:unnamed protein product [Owenia fusiformis]|uniref:CCD97-like C-terminal domain-containing protein n=1 Tax=Owenia fusiformis TaxID=6347 RepID=A0A8S4PBV0_OWEFU|nr:unnamed protein product [Owenia fusiformis]
MDASSENITSGGSSTEKDCDAGVTKEKPENNETMKDTRKVEEDTDIADSQMNDLVNTPDDKTIDDTTSELLCAGNSDNLRHSILYRLANTDAHFKHQQRDEPDLTHKEKYDIANDILEKNVSTFLSRFGKYLQPSDLDYFEPYRGDYIIDFYLKDIPKQQSDKLNKRKVSNRRYEAMKDMTANSDYFSEDSMKMRDPLLYEQMIGKYLDDDEINERAGIDKTDMRMSSIILQHLEMRQESAIRELQRDKEECQMEEEDDDDDDDEDDSEMEEEQETKTKNKDGKLSDGEKLLLRQEFIQTMQERFIDGKDLDFDYSEVDGNVEYDSLAIREQDELEQYFDGDYSDNEQDDVSIESDNTDREFVAMETVADKVNKLAGKTKDLHCKD